MRAYNHLFIVSQYFIRYSRTHFRTIAWENRTCLALTFDLPLAVTFLYTLLMLPQLAGQLLFFLATTSLLPSRASADTANWQFPAYVQNAPPITFESQDTIDAAWTSVFVAPVLVMFCETNNDRNFFISKSIFRAYLS